MTAVAANEYWCETAWLPDGWATGVRLGVDDAGTIVSVAANAEKAGAERIDGAVLPGMPNLHSHAFQRAAAGLTERRHTESDDSFWTWREVMHGFVTRLGPEDQEAIAAQLYIEMLKAGFTAVGEFHYLHLDPAGQTYADPAEMAHRVARAAKRAGIGITLLPVLYSVGGYGGVEPNDGQRRYMLSVDDFLDLVRKLTAAYASDPQVRVGIAPHSVRQVPAEPLAAVLADLDEINATAPIHIHSAEQVKDVDEHVKATGMRPVEWLLENAQVNERWCLVHATHMTGAETKALVKTGAVAGLCLTTEGNLGDGFFPFEEYIAAGGHWGIGSDSHISVSPVEELRWLEYGQRLMGKKRNVAAPGRGGSTGARLYGEALAGGAQALARPVGALATGKRADLVVLDTDHPVLVGRRGDTLLDSHIFSGNTSAVRHVMVGGAWRVRDGHHPEEERVSAAFRDVTARLVDGEL